MKTLDVSDSAPEPPPIDVSIEGCKARVSGMGRTPEEVCQMAGINLDIWEIVKIRVRDGHKSYQGFYRNKPRTHHTVVDLESHFKAYSIDLRKREDRAIVRAMMLDLISDLSRAAKPVNRRIKRIMPDKDGFIHELSVYDPHVGKLTWAAEVGTNQDTKITLKWMRMAYDELRARCPLPVSRYLLPIGNDYYNADSELNTTTTGTPQQEDGRWSKTYTLGRKFIVTLIRELAETAPVDVVVVPGNHDRQRIYFLGDCLEAVFDGHPNVRVYASPDPRKYMRYGRVLLGFVHAHHLKEPKALGITMANECREDWAKAVFCEWHTGHLHTKMTTDVAIAKYFNDGIHLRKLVVEDRAIRVRRLPSMSAPDVYHHDYGFLQIRSAELIAWCPRRGEIAGSSFSVDEIENHIDGRGSHL